MSDSSCHRLPSTTRCSSSTERGQHHYICLCLDAFFYFSHFLFILPASPKIIDLTYCLLWIKHQDSDSDRCDSIRHLVSFVCNNCWEMGDYSIILLDCLHLQLALLSSTSLSQSRTVLARNVSCTQMNTKNQNENSIVVYSNYV